MVRLNQRNNATSPTGIFRCEIPDTSQMDRTIHIGVYHTRDGNSFAPLLP